MRTTAGETLRNWHCRCGYTNVAHDPCKGCHRRAPRQVRCNTHARPQPVAQTALAAELLARYYVVETVVVTTEPSWLAALAVGSLVSMMLIIASLLLIGRADFPLSTPPRTPRGRSSAPA